jgi:ATPase subunit of ABC transporter with duplicated ATPase domains
VLPHSSRDYLRPISYKNKKISKHKMTTIKVRKKIKITVNGYTERIHITKISFDNFGLTMNRKIAIVEQNSRGKSSLIKVSQGVRNKNKI